MNLGGDRGHLTYSTLVHAGDTWDEMWTSLRTFVPRVRERVAPDEAFGVSLRLSAASARTLASDERARAELKAFLADSDMYLYTVNAFPYGPFKGRVVKEQVYEPDWRTDERVDYTIDVANIVADVAPSGTSPSIQTSPLGFKPRAIDADVVERYTQNVLRVAARLIALADETGRTVTLAIEPEPYCFLETTDETIRYFEEHLYTESAATTLGRLAALSVEDAHAALRRHVGIVFDTCHQAVEYEDVSHSLQLLADAGVPVFKLQGAAAVHVPHVTDETVDVLSRYQDTIYLTQTVERLDGRLNRFLNLEDAFAAYARDPGPREWRIHFHVPVFLDELGALGTTRFALEEALAFHRRHPVSQQLEVETYTWDVLPEELKSGDIVEYVCRELEWVRGQLA